jgi:hypothetical protein
MSQYLINASNLTFLSKKETMLIEEPRASAVTTPASTHLKVKYLGEIRFKTTLRWSKNSRKCFYCT